MSVIESCEIRHHSTLSVERGLLNADVNQNQLDLPDGQSHPCLITPPLHPLGTYSRECGKAKENLSSWQQRGPLCMIQNRVDTILNAFYFAWSSTSFVWLSTCAARVPKRPREGVVEATGRVCDSLSTSAANAPNRPIPEAWRGRDTSAAFETAFEALDFPFPSF